MHEQFRSLCAASAFDSRFFRKFFSGVARKRKRLGASVYMHGVTQRGPTYELTMLQSRLLSSFFLVRRRWGMGLRRR